MRSLDRDGTARTKSRRVVLTLFKHIFDDGLQQGLIEGQRRVVLNLLPTNIETRLGAASAADLDRWAARIITADTLEEVFAP